MHKTKLWVIAAIVVLAGMVLMAVLAMTKPDRMEHYDCLKTVVMRAVEAKVDKMVTDEDLRTLATYTALGAANEYLGNNLYVYDHTFYNEGVLVYEGYFIPVSFGVMGHVFLIFGEKEVERMAERVDLQKMIKKENQ